MITVVIVIALISASEGWRGNRFAISGRSIVRRTAVLLPIIFVMGVAAFQDVYGSINLPEVALDVAASGLVIATIAGLGYGLGRVAGLARPKPDNTTTPSA